MECPRCHSTNSKVIDSRSRDGSIRRRRECNVCHSRFSTEEIIVDTWNYPRN